MGLSASPVPRGYSFCVGDIKKSAVRGLEAARAPMGANSDEIPGEMRFFHPYFSHQSACLFILMMRISNVGLLKHRLDRPPRPALQRGLFAFFKCDFFFPPCAQRYK